MSSTTFDNCSRRYTRRDSPLRHCRRLLEPPLNTRSSIPTALTSCSSSAPSMRRQQRQPSSGRASSWAGHDRVDRALRTKCRCSPSPEPRGGRPREFRAPSIHVALSAASHGATSRAPQTAEGGRRDRSGRPRSGVSRRTRHSGADIRRGRRRALGGGQTPPASVLLLWKGSSAVSPTEFHATQRRQTSCSCVLCSRQEGEVSYCAPARRPEQASRGRRRRRPQSRERWHEPGSVRACV
jgi:hypothetical protein